MKPGTTLFRFFLLFAFLLCAGRLIAQEESLSADQEDSLSAYPEDAQADSVFRLSAVTVEGYISGQPLLRTPTSVSIVDAGQLRLQADETFLPAINAVPGVRMEERSPGSYRLSIRGSLLRSPWGVRNVKVYLDEFPLTDAGGNTYLNLVDPRGAGRLEILKGPHGSLFGANSGGVLLISTSDMDAGQRAGGEPRAERDTLAGSALGPGRAAFRRGPDLIKAGLGGGSFGMFHENLHLGRRWQRSRLDLNQAFLRADGYRDHSEMRRHYVQAAHRWNYRPENQLKVLALYADMNYATPGGLNLEQYETDPRQARPPAGPNPGAEEQQAGIQSRTMFGGLSHQFQLRPGLRHMIAVFGSHTDFENPFITNYEVRDEDNYGLRTYFELDGQRNAFTGSTLSRRGLSGWKWHLGVEWQRSHHEISNYDNIGAAVKGDLQAADLVRTSQYFYFTRLTASWWNRLQAEAAVSLNYYQYVFGGLNAGAEGEGAGERKFSPQWMPRLSLSYLLNPAWAWRASVSKGFSPPTTAEIRPSNIIINTALNPETGWNYETGFRFMPAGGAVQADASVFYYRLDEAIVRRLEEGGDEYFVNAGGTGQLGLESRISAQLIESRNRGFIRSFQVSSSYTYSHFRFRDYRQGTDDHSGKDLTGVPGHVLVHNLSLRFPRAFRMTVQHNYTSRIPLDDANSVYADPYHLVQLKIKWECRPGKGRQLELFAGADNLLNEKYSLGNDINAFGGRYYNAALTRNFFGGVLLTL